MNLVQAEFTVMVAASRDPGAPVSMEQANLEAQKLLYTEKIKLDRSKRQIRLLHLDCGEADQGLSCTMVVASLDDEPVYHALSYAWGDTSINRAAISVNNITLEIGRNLATFLRHIRSTKDILILWTDAICINQSDDTEKGHQVPLMGSIYSKTTSCLAWLGLETQHTLSIPTIFKELGEGRHLFQTSAFETLDDASLTNALDKFVFHKDQNALKEVLQTRNVEQDKIQDTEDALKQYRRFNHTVWVRTRPEAKGVVAYEIVTDVDLIKELEEHWLERSQRDGLNGIIRAQSEASAQATETNRRLSQYTCYNHLAWARPRQDMEAICSPWYQNVYFKRIWTYQEICLPEKVTLYWSSGSFDFAEMASTCYRLWQSHRTCCLDPWGFAATYGSDETYTSFAETLTLFWGINAKRSRKGHSSTISSTAFDTIDRSCSKAEDYIYGIMGLIEPPLDVIPNYKKGVGAVFAEAAQISMARVGNVNLLSYASGIKHGIDAAPSAETAVSQPQHEESGCNSCLPSWVPDFSRFPGLLRGLQKRDRGGVHAFQASGDQLASTRYTDDRPTEISIAGILIGVVTGVLLPDNEAFATGDKTVAELVPPTKTLIDKVEGFIALSDKASSGAAKNEMLWRLLLQDLSVLPPSATRATEEDGKVFARLREFLESNLNVEREAPPSVPSELNRILESIAMGQTDSPKRFYVTDKGSFGSVAKLDPWVGDEVWVFLGANVPYLVRPRRENKKLVKTLLVGETYVHGYMDGKAVDEANSTHDHCVLS